MAIEKRQYRRIDINHPAQYALSASFTDAFPAIIVNIAPEGIGFIIDEELEVGTNVYFSLDLEGKKIHLSAEVEWSNKLEDSDKLRVGAKISEVSREDLEKFVRFYCDRLLFVQAPKKKILVVEDEKVMADLLTIELTQSGYDVVCAYDGESGFSKYMDEGPDLIILDIMLPKLNGYEVCRKIRREQDDSKTPIIMLTAKSKDVDRIVGGVIGANKYLIKPFDAVNLLEEIKKMLDE